MFYLTLPSNSSMDTYPNNTLTSYRVKLHSAVNLDGPWEVGLTEIQYPHTWFNISNDEAYFNFKEDEESPNFKVMLKNGFYATPKILVEYLEGVKSMLPRPVWDKVTFTLDDITQTVTVRVKGQARIDLSPLLARVLGFADQQVFHRGIYTASEVVDVAKGFYSLYIYGSVVAPTMVGDTVAPLLRIVPIEGSAGQTITKIYNKIQYIPVQQKQFENIEIEIRDDAGNLVPFERGKVVVILHFRRTRPM